MKSIIFLDIDGVLNSVRSMFAAGPMDVKHPSLKYLQKKLHYIQWFTDPIAVKLLNKLTDETGAVVVISSTHRLMGWPICADALARVGMTATVIGATPVFQSGIRGEEIQAWLNDNPSVTNYVIFDDDSDMLDDQLSRFVHVDSDVGLTVKNIQDAKSILIPSFHPRQPG